MHIEEDRDQECRAYIEELAWEQQSEALWVMHEEANLLDNIRNVRSGECQILKGTD